METNEVIDGLLAQEELTSQDRIWMFMMLVDDKVIMQSLKRHAMLLKVEMASDDPVYGLAYAVMRLAKPHLFDGET